MQENCKNPPFMCPLSAQTELTVCCYREEQQCLCFTVWLLFAQTDNDGLKMWYSTSQLWVEITDSRRVEVALPSLTHIYCLTSLPVQQLVQWKESGGASSFKETISVSVQAARLYVSNIHVTQRTSALGRYSHAAARQHFQSLQRGKSECVICQPICCAVHTVPWADFIMQPVHSSDCRGLKTLWRFSLHRFTQT